MRIRSTTIFLALAAAGALSLQTAHAATQNTPHRHTAQAKASAADTTKPQRVGDTMAFMVETRAVIRPTRFALETAQLQHEYYRCWQGLERRFDPSRR